MKSKWRRCCCGLLLASVGLIILELVLRWGLGLGHSPIVQGDPQVGYYYKANQELYRFGNRIAYNSYHQRSDRLRTQPGYRLLLLGDSISDGGSLIDQSQTISELLRQKLNRALGKPGEVLNASAAGWALENRYQYLQKFGNLNADAVIIQLATNDLWQVKNTMATRTRHPAEDTTWALGELYHRACYYLFGDASPPQPVTATPAPDVRLAKNLHILTAMIRRLSAAGKPTLVLLIPEKKEVATNQLPEELTTLFQTISANSALLLHVFPPQHPLHCRHFRDNVHLSCQGNEVVATAMVEPLRKLLTRLEDY